MNKAYSLYVQGKLRAAISELGEQLRSEPSNAKARTFLFELLCFAGEFDRAEKQLDVLATNSEAASAGAAFYHDLLSAHRQREGLLEKKRMSDSGEITVYAMKVNEISYLSCADADDRVEDGLEIYGPAGYEVIPWKNIQRLESPKPARLRDLLWIPATLFLSKTETTVEPYPVYLPALAPGTWRHSDESVCLGRTTVLDENSEGHLSAFGAKLLLCDEEAIRLLDVRTIEVQL